MESDIFLIQRVKKDGDPESLCLLIERHSGIYLDMVNSVIPNNCDFLDKNDIIEEKDISIYKAILNFDPDKNTKFSTYLGNETKWRCLNLFNRGVKYKHIDIDDFKEDSNFIEDETFESIHSKEILDKIFAYAENHSDKRISEIINLRYKVGLANKTMPWKEIAKKINLSIQGCINIHNKFIEEIKKELHNV